MSQPLLEGEYTGKMMEPPPFSIRVLPEKGNNNISASLPAGEEPLSWVLPTAYRTRYDNLVAPRPDDLTYIEQELDLHRLTDVLD